VKAILNSLKTLKKSFQTVKTTKPPSSKRKWRMYIVGRGFRKEGR
jgi:23S rRNA (uridine2552-2'-O)-methyltransferase